LPSLLPASVLSTSLLPSSSPSKVPSTPSSVSPTAVVSQLFIEYIYLYLYFLYPIAYCVLETFF
jgi:hypothetical protein